MLTIIILAIIQGLTEFLPISSSGHLLLFNHLYGAKSLSHSHLTTVVLHSGTMLATILVFRTEVWGIIRSVFSFITERKLGIREIRTDDNLWLGFLIVVGSIPTGIIGLLFRKSFESLSDNGNLWLVGLAFLVTGVILFSTRYIRRESKTEYRDITVWDSLFIGLIQGIAITPGISRSGITISGGLWRNIKREKIGHFSFLLSLPAIFGATILELRQISHLNSHDYILLVVGFIVSFSVGYLSLKLLLTFVNRGKFQYFSYYCWLAGIVTLMISINR